MNCPLCNHNESVVYDTRKLHNTVRRCRRCFRCQHRWTTYEVGAKAMADLDQQITALLSDTIGRMQALRNGVIGSAQPNATTREEHP